MNTTNKQAYTTCRRWKKSALTALFILGILAPSSQAVSVDLELQLLNDISGSVDNDEYLLMRDGYSAAFRSARIQSALTSGPNGGIAVQFIYWSSADGHVGQQIMHDWTHIDSVASANAFADALDLIARPFVAGSTDVGGAIDFGVTEFVADNGFESLRQIMDIASDGKESVDFAGNTAIARDAALAAGIDGINALTIGKADVNPFYVANAIGGPDSFSIHVDGYEVGGVNVFADAIEEKLYQEITAATVPEPSSAALLGLGSLALILLRRK